VSSPLGSSPIALIQKGDWCGSELIRHRHNENRRRVRGYETESRGSTESVSGHEEIGRAIERGQLNGDLVYSSIYGRTKGQNRLKMAHYGVE
jgi:hypothetical protein